MMKMITKILFVAVGIVSIAGCNPVSNSKREAVAKTYADFIDGTVVSCNHPQYDNQKSECLVEIDLGCKKIIMVDDVGAEVKEEICPED